MKSLNKSIDQIAYDLSIDGFSVLTPYRQDLSQALVLFKQRFSINENLQSTSYRYKPKVFKASDMMVDVLTSLLDKLRNKRKAS